MKQEQASSLIISPFSDVTMTNMYPVVLFLYMCPVAIFGEQLRWRRIITPGVRDPPARKYAAIGKDTNPSRRFLVIFGGIGRDGLVLNDTWVLDIPGRRWYDRMGESLSPGPRQGMISGVYNGKFYIVGGCDGERCFDDVWAFDIASFKWAQFRPRGSTRPSPRMGAAGGIYPGASDLIVSEGRDHGDFFSSTYMLDLAQERWFLLESQQMTYSPSVPHGRSYHGSVMITSSQLAIFGGCVKHGPCPSADFWVFRADRHTWERLETCSPAREDASLMLYNTTIAAVYVVVFGGKTDGGQMLGGKSLDAKDVYLFELRTRTWFIKRIQDDAPSVRSGAAAVSAEKQIFVFGGENNNGELMNDLWELSGDVNESPDSSVECQSSFFTLISLHGLLMIISCLIGFSGFICGLCLVPKTGHFRSVHGGLGLSLVCLTGVQGLLILLTKYLDKRRSSILKFHFWLGLAVMTLSVVNISLGLFLGMSDSGVWISWFVYVLIVMILFIVMQTVAVFSEEQDQSPHPGRY